MISRRDAMVGMGAALGALAGRSGRASAADELAAAIGEGCRRIESGTGGRLGVAIMDTQTGTRLGHRGGERFPILSTFKLLAGGALLRRVDAGEASLDRRIRYEASDLVANSPGTEKRVAEGMTLAELCEAMMTLSDNTAANLVLKQIGGPDGITQLARSLGDPVTRLDRWETALNEATPGDPRDTTTPDAMAGNIRQLVLGDALSAQSRERLTAWFVANKTGDARLRAGFPGTWRVGDRTGTGNHGSTNDIACAWPPGRAPIIVCVYLTEIAAELDARNAAIADVGRLVAKALAA